MTSRKSKTAIERKNAWIKREHAALIEGTKRHGAISFQAALDDFIEAALKQRRLIPSAGHTVPVEPLSSAAL